LNQPLRITGHFVFRRELPGNGFNAGSPGARDDNGQRSWVAMHGCQKGDQKPQQEQRYLNNGIGR
jgi:hypothetical protein